VLNVKAGILHEKKEEPTLGELVQLREAMENNPINKELKKRREKDRKRAIYFKAGYSTAWGKTPIHKIIGGIKKNFPELSWLRVSMSYHRFMNVREIFQGDLNKKVTEGVVSLDFRNLTCNCRNKEGCPYKGHCGSPIVVYQATDLTTNKRYIGNTQQFVKKRMQQHVQDVKRLVTQGKSSDSFAAHFARSVPEGTEKKQINGFVKIKVDILWQGDPLATVKTFGTKKCKLCAKERVAILRMTKFTPHLAINTNNEIYGACRHKPRFHRFDLCIPASTDESVKDERIPQVDTANNDESKPPTEDKKIIETKEPTVLTKTPYQTYRARRIEGTRARAAIGTTVGLISPTGSECSELTFDDDKSDLSVASDSIVEA
jgi:hypothetical protein